MKPYRVEGGAGEIGAGETIGLTARQYSGREHLLEDVRERGGIRIGKTKAVVQLKAGETVLLDTAPPKSTEHFFVPIGEPASERERAVSAKAKPAPKAPRAKKPSPGPQMSTTGLTTRDGAPVGDGVDIKKALAGQSADAQPEQPAA